LSATSFSFVFVSFVLAALIWRALLAVRQIRHVAKHRGSVPGDFAAFVPLEAHRKAADYTLDRQRVGLAETLVIDGVVLLALTLGGGIAAIDQLSQRAFGEGYARDLGTVFGVLLVTTLLALPFDTWRTFAIEARYGFNRTTPKLFVFDLAKGTLLAVALGTPLLLAVFWLVRAAGPYWWFYTWLAWIAFTVALVMVFPRWIAATSVAASRRSSSAAASTPRASS